MGIIFYFDRGTQKPAFPSDETQRIQVMHVHISKDQNIFYTKIIASLQQGAMKILTIFLCFFGAWSSENNCFTG